MDEQAASTDNNDSGRILDGLSLTALLWTLMRKSR